MIWISINVVLSIVVGVIIAIKLTVWIDRFNCPERVGMGLLGAGCILTIGPILLAHGSPYENWSGSLMRIGLATYFLGRMCRHKGEIAR